MNNGQLARVADGNIPADLILANANIVDVFSGTIRKNNVAIFQGKITGIGKYKQADRIIDLEGKYLVPGFIDGHVHIESSMLDVPQYVQAVTPHGTTSIVTDLHEIANVSGITGMKYVMDSARLLPMDIYLMAPSCVPSTNLETSGTVLDIETLKKVMKWDNCLGLGEVMNYPGVINGDKDMLDKLESFRGKIIDGHAPGLTGQDLDAYIGAGIQSDHESVTLEEAQEKLNKGMYVMIREGSSEKNLETLFPLVTDETYKRCMFVIDDKSSYDILHDGDIDGVVRKAVSLGMDPVRAIQMVTINPAEYFKLDDVGEIAPGYRANLVVIDDLSEMTISSVFYKGEKIAENGKSLYASADIKIEKPKNTIHIKPFDADALKIKADSDMFPVIEIVPGQIITKKTVEKVSIENGEVMPDRKRDILKAVVFERHRATGNIGVGLVKGFGLRKGAIASSVAHDSHNVVVVGTNDDDIISAVKEIERMQGGLVAVVDGNVQARLALPVAGILSDDSLENVVEKLSILEKAAVRMGVQPIAPFSILSFLSLPVIPELRLTDLGIVDVLEFRLL